VPEDKVDDMMQAMEGLTEREAKIISAANEANPSVEKIKAAFRG
jgi:hypothetical protein